ncbi:MAG: two-component system response regulator [Bacteroidetes bacterium]|nr:two-component system response regulator [Bacteroidota bacterium]
MDTPNKKILNLIIADDDPDDQYMMQKVIWEMNPNHKITAVYNGMQLMDCLQKTGMYKNASDTLPDGIFLDLNMPLLNGTEAMKRIKKNPSLTHLPVYILSTSKSANEKENLLSIGAQGFYTKTHEYQGLKKIMNEILLDIYKINSGFAGS